MFNFIRLSLIVFACWPASYALASNFTAKDVTDAIRQFGPIMKLSPDEKYLMDDPKTLMEDPSHPVMLQGAIIPNEDDYEALKEGVFYQKSKIVNVTSSNIAGVDPAKIFPDIYGKSNFHYFLRFQESDSVLGGNQKRASRIVAVKEFGQYLYITFWFFYPFNGPGRACVGAVSYNPCTNQIQKEKGRHYGDWEHVTIRVSKVNNYLRLTGLYLSRHGFNPWYSDLTKFQRRGSQPVIYIAINSHAHYPRAGEHIYDRRKVAKGVLAISTYDEPKDGGQEFDTSKPERRIVVESNVPGFDIDPTQQGWWTFRQRWGQYIANAANFAKVTSSYIDKEVESAPTAPITKDPDEVHFIDAADAMAFGQAFNSSGALDVFALAAAFDGRCCRIEHNYLGNSRRWSGWENDFRSAPRVSSIVGGNYNGDAHFFAIGYDDKKIYHNWLGGQGWQRNWNDANLPDPGQVRFAAFGESQENGKKHAEVFAERDGDGAMLHTWTDRAQGGWRKWTVSSFGFLNDITFMRTAYALDSLFVVVINKDGKAAYARLQNGHWSNASAIPGSPTLQSLAIAADKPLELLAVGTDQHLYHTTFNGTWSAWDKDFRNAPAPVRFVSLVSGGNLECFLIDGTRAVRHNWKSGNTWHSWDIFRDKIPPVYRVLSYNQVGHTIETFAITTEDSLAHAWLDGNWQGWTQMFFDGSGE